MQKIYETYSPKDKSIFVPADIEKYRSASSKKKHVMNLAPRRRMQCLSLLVMIGHLKTGQNSFTKATAGIEDNGYIATLQKTIGSLFIFFDARGKFSVFSSRRILCQTPPSPV